ncbi:MAG: GyrI-like domain-containing protein [Deltaproteobacteria bacterium]|nr:GyrI-like domain-containing protein [Deltaproteobacteria bacterium]
MKIRRLTEMSAIAAAVLMLWGCPKKETVTEVVEPEPEPVETFPIEEVEPFNYVCVEMVGGYDKHGVVISQLVVAIKEQEIDLKGPMFGIYYNSPKDVPPDLLKWEVGFPAIVDMENPPASPLVAKTWEYPWVVATVYTGPYQGTEETYEKIQACDDYEIAGPAMERFLDENPDMIEPDDLKTEVWVPVQEPEPEVIEPEEGTVEGDEAAAEGDEAAAEVIEPEEKPAKKDKKKGK